MVVEVEEDLTGAEGEASEVAGVSVNIELSKQFVVNMVSYRPQYFLRHFALVHCCFGITDKDYYFEK